MKKFLTATISCAVLACAFFMLSGMSAYAADTPANSLEKAGYTLDFNDEFDSTALDSSKWIDYYLPHWCDDTSLAKAQYKFEDGCLVEYITSDQRAWCPEHDGTVKSSAIMSFDKSWIHNFSGTSDNHARDTWYGYATTYGYFEIRAKLANCGGGGHQAWWFVGMQQDTNDWSNSRQTGEIDALETFFSTPNTWRIAAYGWNDPNFQTGWYCSTDSISGTPTAEFHIYAMDWQEERLDFYYDNVLYKTIYDSPDYPMGMILNIYTDAGSGTHNDVWPKQWAVDYIRVWKSDGSGSTTDENEIAIASASAESVQTGNEASKAIDNSGSTIWHTYYSSGTATTPNFTANTNNGFTMTLSESTAVDTLTYLPRQDGSSNGRITGYKVYYSTSASGSFVELASGTWANNSDLKTVSFDAVNARRIQIRATATVGDSANTWISAAEFKLYNNGGESGGEPTTEGYALYNSASGLENGTYLIINGTNKAMSSTASGSGFSNSTVAISGNAISSAVSACEWTITNVSGSTYYVRNSAGSYLNIGSGGLSLSSSAQAITITYVSGKYCFSNDSYSIDYYANDGQIFSTWYSDNTNANQQQLLYKKSGTTSGGDTLTARTISSASAESVQSGEEASLAIDGDTSTFWHSYYSSGTANTPNFTTDANTGFTLTLSATSSVSKIGYLPRQDGGINGIITGYTIYYSTSASGDDFVELTSGTWASDNTLKTAAFDAVNARRIQIRANSTYGSSTNSWISAAEFCVYG